MNYGDLLERTVRAIWQHKFLVLLGIVLSIIAGDGRGNPVITSLFREPGQSLPSIPRLSDWQRLIPIEVWERAGQFYRFVSQFGLAGWLAAAVIVLALVTVVGIVFIVARGALIAGANEVAAEGKSSLRSALATSWRRAWRLIIIASIPPIPVTIAAIMIVALATVTLQRAGGIDVLNRPEARPEILGGLSLALAAILCPFGIATFALKLLSGLADRACIIEDRKVIESYQRGWHVLRRNLGSVVILGLLQLVLESAVASALLVPRLLAGLCFVFVLVWWVTAGILRTFFIALWTLAWREWTTESPPAEANLPPNTAAV